MKIEKLLAPKQQEVVTESDAGTSTSASVASVSQPLGRVKRRGKGSMLQGIKTSDKFPNSVSVKEGAYEDGVNDGIRGEANPRASSIYGPESGEYSRGYKDGLVKGKEQQQANVSAYQAKLAPYKEIPTDKLKQMLRDIRKRSDEIQAIFNKYKGASLFGGDAPPNTEELRAEGKKNNEAWQAIHQELFQRGVPNDQRLEEADEWEEEGDKFQRFLAYAQKQLEAADPAQRISLARRLSMWQVKHFGPENNQSYNPNTGAAIQGNNDITPSIRAILEIVNRPSGQTFSSTVASIPSPQQVEIDNSWRLTDEGKEWLAYAKEELQKAGVNSSDFMEVARALSQQQVKKFGRASMDTRNNITAEISMIIDKIRWLGVVATQQANQNIIDADLTVTELMDKYNNASPQEQATFRAGVERDYGMSVQEFFDYLQEHDQLPQARRQPEDALAEVKKANTKTARKELSKKPKAELSGKDKEAKQSESDRLWAMLQQHIADAEKNKDVKEGEEMSTFAALKDWRVWDVRVFNNYYRGKYADYGPRLYSVVASSPEEARQVVINNADYVLQDLLSRKLQNGKKVLPRGSALPVEEKRVGQADPGTITTMGLKKMLTPDGVQSFKFTNGKIVDGAHMAGGEQVEEANSFLKPGPQATGKFPEPRKPSFPGDRGSKSETLGRDGLIYHWQDPRAKQVNEKSKSQAQFRTMAAVAHNPEFAKKVGISQKVGKEFHSADKGADYKSLPKKVDEAEVSEDKLASDLYKDLQIFKKGADKEIGAKAKDKEISNKAKDKDIVAKEGFGDTIKQGAKKAWDWATEPTHQAHDIIVKDRAKNIAKIRKQNEKKSVFEKDPEAMREFERSGGYEAGLDVMGWQVGWAAASHARPGDTMKDAFQKLYYGGGSPFPFSQKAFRLAWVAYFKHHGPEAAIEEDCWDGYEQYGMKKKNGKTVPNCVPKK